MLFDPLDLINGIDIEVFWLAGNYRHDAAALGGVKVERKIHAKTLS